MGRASKDFFSPSAYAREGLKIVQRTTEQGLQATEQVAQQGLRVAEEVTEQTEEVLHRTEEATKRAERVAAVFVAPHAPAYEELTVDEISRRFGGLSVKQLEQVREYEKQNKDRETLIEQIDRKIRAKNS